MWTCSGPGRGYTLTHSSMRPPRLCGGCWVGRVMGSSRCSCGRLHFRRSRSDRSEHGPRTSIGTRSNISCPSRQIGERCHSRMAAGRGLLPEDQAGCRKPSRSVERLAWPDRRFQSARNMRWRFQQNDSRHQSPGFATVSAAGLHSAVRQDLEWRHPMRALRSVRH
jgi:hypothetical protein